ncbi:MAG: glycosyltransferase [Chitinophagaceae bacterium]|nr:MAG: glycosyltransferase [Chitinophagaceae bacterium]
MSAKRITVSVISDLTTDQRVIRISSTLQQMGFDVTVIARSFNNSLSLDSYPFRAERIRCRFRKGLLQYAEFNLKLFFKLLFVKTDYFLANDLDVLLPNYLVSSLRNKKIFYDTHEYFTGVPELRNAPAKRKVWKTLEDWIFPKLPIVYTVNDSVKNEYEKEYLNQLQVIRNVPVTEDIPPLELPTHWQGRKILLMQGAGINVGRGGLQLLEAARLLSKEYLVVFIGSGTEWETISQKRMEWKLESRVEMISKVRPAVLKQYTRLAHVGFSLDSFDDINYLFNLPNKIFDYIHAGVPIVATAIPEVKKILDEYKCGICIPSLEPQTIKEAIESILKDEAAYNNMKLYCLEAAKELSWENESKKLQAIYQPYL